MYGFYNRILNIDLSIKQARVETIDDRIYSMVLGGKGLASWILSERNPAGVDPLSADNHLIFATGPATGGVIWGSQVLRRLNRLK